MAKAAIIEHKKFRIKHLPELLKRTYKEWNADDPWRLSAIVAYYAVLSLPGLVVVIINTVGAIWGNDIVQGRLTNEIADAIGQSAADSIQEIVAGTQGGDKSFISTIIGLATLIFGATGVFYHLQLSLNIVWDLKQVENAGFKKLVKDRIMGFGFVMVVGFLLLVSFALSAVLALLNGYLERIFSELSVYIAMISGEVLSLGVITVLFTLLFKFLPDAKIRWRSVWVGGLLTAVLFSIGKYLLGLYFGSADPSSTYGAAGSMVLILLWVSYSCLILFFGAEFTWVYANTYGHSIMPNNKATFIRDEVPHTHIKKKDIHIEHRIAGNREEAELYEKLLERNMRRKDMESGFTSNRARQVKKKL
ncbi:YihY/virulence factor BrkB family protein [Cryomorpha ignava]|uniref:YihY/virulence factor BrkB family protein n=2 Tax=Cryomorpha ignava TaxID=101383 RepID=A0A7K3WL20_9FLAO|nr:YihY/virulence factor BrkB family protein [Cryomorpha ignava]